MMNTAKENRYLLDGFRSGKNGYRTLEPALHWLVYDEKMRAVYVCFDQETAKNVRDLFFPTGSTGYSWCHVPFRTLYDW